MVGWGNKCLKIIIYLYKGRTGWLVGGNKCLKIIIYLYKGRTGWLMRGEKLNFSRRPWSNKYIVKLKTNNLYNFFIFKGKVNFSI